MCLTIDAAITEKVRRKLKKGGGKAKFWVVKDAVASRGELFSYWRCFLWCDKPGLLRSDRRRRTLTKRERDERSINRGFHVYLTRAAAEYWTGHIAVAVPVWGNSKDFVVAGRHADRHSAVFTKLTVLKADFDKAVGRKK